MSEPAPKRARLTDEGTPRRHRRSRGRRLAVTDGEGSSPIFQARTRPVSLRMVKDSPVRRAIQNSVTVFKLSKGPKTTKKPSGSSIEALIKDPSPLYATISSSEHQLPLVLPSIVPQTLTLPEKLVPGGDYARCLPMTAISSAPLACTG